jgi:conjugative relaxase-like TrwC/TraI family protein
MLSLAKAAKDYYLQKLGEMSPREDYYLRGGTAAGRWVGSGAAELELRGTVSAKGLVRLFDGEHPVTGKRLGRRLRKDGVAAWDITFSADKSVSLLWALGDEYTRKEVVEAFQEATSEALGFLESVASDTRGASKRIVVDEEGNRKCQVKTWPIPTSGYVAAAFTEYTSRADDPQLHTHVVIANKVRGEDGVWRTLDGRLLYRHQLAAGYLHEAVLRKELTERLGVHWQPVHKGTADIEGFTRTQIEAFSRRREQLETWREEQNLPDTPAARQIAVVATREPKRDHPLEELGVEWRQRAAEVGLTPERIDRMLGRGRQVSTPDRTRLFARLASPEGLSKKASTFGRSEAVREIAASLPEGGDRDQIEALADQILADDQVVTLARGAGEDLQYTTAELMATEQRIIDRAENRAPIAWRAPRRLVEAVLRRRPHLTDDQREMVRRLATSGAGIDVGVGPAGSGKTSVMAVVAHLAALTGTPIIGTALAARTAVGLQEATRISSSSLTALSHRATSEGGLPDGVVVVVDEASMVGTRQLATLSDHVERASGKLILIGDPHQLPEIEAGGLFQTLVDRLPAVELHHNVRQERSWERTALAELRNGSVADALAFYRKHRRLVIGRTRDETLVRAVDDWYQHVTITGNITDSLLLARDNETVKQLNVFARGHLANSGHLTGPALEVDGREYQRGDRVICLKNDPRLGVLNGDLATVVNVDRKKGTLNVHLDRDSEPRSLPDRYLNEGYIDHGYALSGHKAQGITVDRTFAVMGGGTSREWAYVVMSRGRESNDAYLVSFDMDEQCAHLPHQDRGDPLEVAVSNMQRRERRGAAVELGLGL